MVLDLHGVRVSVVVIHVAAGHLASRLAIQPRWHSAGHAHGRHPRAVAAGSPVARVVDIPASRTRLPSACPVSQDVHVHVGGGSRVQRQCQNLPSRGDVDLDGCGVWGNVLLPATGFAQAIPLAMASG